ncbi:hypothetical protein HK101_011105 [Irineochytrium annulatum]|nr:hypothetical protein HK101_011105 [Irineochytrium annulatum]
MMGHEHQSNGDSFPPRDDSGNPLMMKQRQQQQTQAREEQSQPMHHQMPQQQRDDRMQDGSVEHQRHEMPMKDARKMTPGDRGFYTPINLTLHWAFWILRKVYSLTLVRLFSVFVFAWLATIRFTPSIVSNIFSLIYHGPREIRDRLDRKMEEVEEMRAGCLDGSWTFRPTDIVSRTPERRFAMVREFPYAPRYFPYCGCNVAYVMERDDSVSLSGQTIVLVHGNPTWSYEFRKVFKGLMSAGHVVVAVDLIGYGRSDKLARPELYSLDLHVGTIQRLFKHLDLRDAVLCGHDWGGCLNLLALEGIFNRVSGLVLMDSFLFPMARTEVSLSSLCFLAAWDLASATFGSLIPMSFIARFMSENITSFEIYGYAAPFHNSRARLGTSEIPHIFQLPWLTHMNIWKRLKRSTFRRNLELICPPLALLFDNDVRMEKRTLQAREMLRDLNKPVLLIYGADDQITLDFFWDFQRWIPEEAKSFHDGGVLIRGAGHLVVEDKPEVVTKELLGFLDHVSSMPS